MLIPGLREFSVARGQFAEDPATQGAASLPGGRRNLYQTNRNLVRALTQAESMLSRGEYEDGLDNLQRLIALPDDSFLPPEPGKETEPGQSLKSRIWSLISKLPENGRRIYETRYGRVAERLLRDGIEQGRTDLLEQVVRNYFLTRAGQEATYRLASYQLDHSRYLAAAQLLEAMRKHGSTARWEPMLSMKEATSWLRANNPARATEILREIKRKHGNGKIAWRGGEVELFENDRDAVAWLSRVAGIPDRDTTLADGTRDWLNFRGDAGRNALSSGITPIWDGKWTRSTIIDEGSPDQARQEAAAARLKQIESDPERGGGGGAELTLPAVHPLVIGNRVVVRTMGGLAALNTNTGDVVWRTEPTDLAYDMLVNQGKQYLSNRSGRTSTYLDMFLAQRAWHDLTAGTLSSDGRLVFSLEDLGLLATNTQVTFRGIPTNPLEPKRYNTLRAVDVETGRLHWETGGPRGEVELEAAGAFFLGPVLPLGHELYSLVEQAGEIQLLVLDAANGRKLWSQSLATPQLSLDQYGIRRLSGISPAASDGIVVCPTTAACLVAVDLSRRMLLWSYSYEDDLPKDIVVGRAAIFAARNGRGNQGTDEEDRWLDASPTIAEGCVLITPRDSNEIHCLELGSGKLKWKRPRGLGLYLACVDNGRAVVVHRNEIVAYRLSDGEPAWKQPTPIVAGPSGRGYRTAGKYHLPLQSGEIVTVDLTDGRVLASSSLRSGKPGGNLVAAGGTIFSQTVHSISAFRSRDDIEQTIATELKSDKTVPEALSLRGELRLHDGDEQGALDDLRKSLSRQGNNPRAKNLLALALLDRLRLDFKTYRPLTDELDRLITDPAMRLRFLRLHATGLEEAGDRPGAMAAYLRIAEQAVAEAAAAPATSTPPASGDSVTNPTQLENGTKGAAPVAAKPGADLQNNGLISIRNDIWAAFRIQKLYQQSNMAEKQAFDRQFDQLVARAILPVKGDAETAKSRALLRALLLRFGQLPATQPLRMALVERLDATKDQAEIEILLQALQSSSDVTMAGRATARLGQLAVQEGRTELVAALLPALATRYGDVVCLEGRTGKQLAQTWKEALDKTLAARSTNDLFVNKKLTGERSARRRANNGQRLYPIDRVGESSSEFQGWSFQLDVTRQTLHAFDAQGEPRWQLTFANGQRISYNYWSNTIRSRGHLLVLTLGNQFVVISGFQNSPRVLWRGLLHDASNDRNTYIRVQTQQVLLPNGRPRIEMRDANSRPLGNVAPLSSEGLYSQAGTKLLATELLNGQTLWERAGIPRGCILFSDGGELAYVDREGGEATILRAADGEVKATVTCPPPSTWMHYDRRRVAAWVARGQNMELIVHDVLKGQKVWSQMFGKAARIEMFDEREVAVIEPSGRLRIFETITGKPLLDQQLGSVANLQDFFFRRQGDNYLVFLRLLDKEAINNPLRQVSVGYNNLMVDGPAFAFERKTGRLVWSRQISNQSFDPMQSDTLPILTFVTRRYEIVQPRGFTRSVVNVEVVDIRNGRTVLEYSGNDVHPPFAMQTDAEKKMIRISFVSVDFEVKASEQPLEPAMTLSADKPAAAEPKGPVGDNKPLPNAPPAQVE